MSVKCKFCGAVVSKDIPGWWNKNNCLAEKCLELKRQEVKEKNRAKVRRKTATVAAVKDIVQPLNGRKCQASECGQRLRGPWRKYCPDCHARKAGLAGRMDGYHKYHDHETGDDWQWMKLTLG
jgi:hypothetical protein